MATEFNFNDWFNQFELSTEFKKEVIEWLVENSLDTYETLIHFNAREGCPDYSYLGLKLELGNWIR